MRGDIQNKFDKNLTSYKMAFKSKIRKIEKDFASKIVNT
jgi:hypothetical protein